MCSHQTRAQLMQKQRESHTQSHHNITAITSVGTLWSQGKKRTLSKWYVNFVKRRRNESTQKKGEFVLWRDLMLKCDVTKSWNEPRTINFARVHNLRHPRVFACAAANLNKSDDNEMYSSYRIGGVEAKNTPSRILLKMCTTFCIVQTQPPLQG